MATQLCYTYQHLAGVCDVCGIVAGAGAKLISDDIQAIDTYIYLNTQADSWIRHMPLRKAACGTRTRCVRT